MSRLQKFSFNLFQNNKVSNGFWKSADNIPILHISVTYAALHLTLDSFNLYLLPVQSLVYMNPTNLTCSEKILFKGGQHNFCPSQPTHTGTFEQSRSLIPWQTAVWKKTADLLTK